MKTILFLLFIFPLFLQVNIHAQKSVLIPDLSEATNSKIWSVINRKVTYDQAVYLDKKPGDGILRLNDFIFKNGSIELDIKGKNEQGASFVGVAFHGLDNSTFDAIYFRPFNFKNADRRNHSVQYVSLPQYDWNKLREQFPGKYENVINPVPDPDAWFHATIVIEYPNVKVFVDNAKTPSLTISQLSTRKEGWVGLWVGNTSEGYFRNLKITAY